MDNKLIKRAPALGRGKSVSRSGWPGECNTIARTPPLKPQARSIGNHLRGSLAARLWWRRSIMICDSPRCLLQVQGVSSYF